MLYHPAVWVGDCGLFWAFRPSLVLDWHGFFTGVDADKETTGNFTISLFSVAGSYKILIIICTAIVWRLSLFLTLPLEGSLPFGCFLFKFCFMVNKERETKWTQLSVSKVFNLISFFFSRACVWRLQYTGTSSFALRYSLVNGRNDHFVFVLYR